MKNTTLAQNKTGVQARELATTGVSNEISKGAMAAMGGFSLAVGLWAVACFVGGIVSAGPVEMIRGWFGAVTGM